MSKQIKFSDKIRHEKVHQKMDRLADRYIEVKNEGENPSLRSLCTDTDINYTTAYAFAAHPDSVYEYAAERQKAYLEKLLSDIDGSRNLGKEALLEALKDSSEAWRRATQRTVTEALRKTSPTESDQKYIEVSDVFVNWVQKHLQQFVAKPSEHAEKIRDILLEGVMADHTKNRDAADYINSL